MEGVGRLCRSSLLSAVRQTELKRILGGIEAILRSGIFAAPGTQTVEQQSHSRETQGSYRELEGSCGDEDGSFKKVREADDLPKESRDKNIEPEGDTNFGTGEKDCKCIKDCKKGCEKICSEVEWKELDSKNSDRKVLDQKAEHSDEASPIKANSPPQTKSVSVAKISRRSDGDIHTILSLLEGKSVVFIPLAELHTCEHPNLSYRTKLERFSNPYFKTVGDKDMSETAQFLPLLIFNEALRLSEKKARSYGEEFFYSAGLLKMRDILLMSFVMLSRRVEEASSRVYALSRAQRIARGNSAKPKVALLSSEHGKKQKGGTYHFSEQRVRTDHSREKQMRKEHDRDYDSRVQNGEESNIGHDEYSIVSILKDLDPVFVHTFLTCWFSFERLYLTERESNLQRILKPFRESATLFTALRKAEEEEALLPPPRNTEVGGSVNILEALLLVLASMFEQFCENNGRKCELNAKLLICLGAIFQASLCSGCYAPVEGQGFEHICVFEGSPSEPSSHTEEWKILLKFKNNPTQPIIDYRKHIHFLNINPSLIVSHANENLGKNRKKFSQQNLQNFTHTRKPVTQFLDLYQNIRTLLRTLNLNIQTICPNDRFHSHFLKILRKFGNAANHCHALYHTL